MENITNAKLFNNYEIRKRINPELLQNLKLTIEKRPNQEKHFVGWIFSCISQNNLQASQQNMKMNYCVCKIIFNFYKFNLR